MDCSTTWNWRNKLFQDCMISNKEYREKYKTNFMKQAKEILVIPKPEIDRTYHQREYWIENRGLFREVINIFSQMFQNNGCGIPSCNNYLMTNGKINTLHIVLFTDASLNLIKKRLWFILCYFLKFKVCVHYFLSKFHFSPNDSPSETMKNVFYFM